MLVEIIILSLLSVRTEKLMLLFLQYPSGERVSHKISF